MKHRKLLLLPVLALGLAGCSLLDVINDNKQQTESKDEKDKDEEVEATLSLNKTSLTIKVGESETLVATAANGEGAVTWSSSASAIVSVGTNGELTALAEGSATITASYSGKTATCAVTVAPADAKVVKSIILDKGSLILDTIDNISATLAPTVDADEGVDTTVTWTVAPQGVVSLDKSSGAKNESVAVTALKAGNATITATCGDKSATCVVTVKGLADFYSLSGVTKNVHIKDFETNVANSEGTFKGETSDVLEVGDDNALQLKPTLSIIDKGTWEPVSESVWDFDYEYSIKEFNGSEYAETTTNYGAFDAKKCAFDFNEAAIGKQFELTVLPGGLTADQKAQAKYKTTVKVKVSNGYNVYTANELAYFNDINMAKNYRQEEDIAAEYNANWIAFRTAHGLSADYVAPSIFLQSNIKITKDNVPTEFFFANDEEAGIEGAGGKLRDGTDVYIRYASDFKFNGNYFNVDTTEFPVCGNCTSAKDNISHSTLFKVCENRIDASVTSELTFMNCSYFGNGPRGDDMTARLGLIFFKVHNVSQNKDTGLVTHATFDNFNVLRAVISFYTEYGPSLITIKDCKTSESYSNGIFLYENGDLEIINSELTNFGGPIIVTTGNEDTKNGFHINVDDKSVLTNFVLGSEPWFVNTEATTAIQLIQGADVLLNGCGKTLMGGENGTMNVVLVNYGECGYVEFTKAGSNPVGFDEDSANASTIQTALGEGQTVFMTEKGALVPYAGETPELELLAPIAISEILDLMMLNPAFGYIHFITYLLPFAG